MAFHAYLNTAIKAARKAGEQLTRAFDRLDTVKVHYKNGADIYTSADLSSEKVILEILKEAYPTHAILAEESGQHGQSDYLWTVDPLDGTRNFIHGIPHFAICISFSLRGTLEHGLVYDPIRQELFTASRGRGAQLNERRLRVSPAKMLENAMLGTGWPFDSSQLAHIATHSDIRCLGSAALDLAYVAAGRLDGYFESELKPWDIAAGSLLVQEAGGLVTDFEGSSHYLETGNILAATPKLLKPLQEIFLTKKL